MKSDNKVMTVGILTAISASLCCITPVLALIAGTSGVASTFSWIEPFRPCFIGLTVLVLGFAWYQKLIPKVFGTEKQADCECDTDTKPKFIQSKLFLGLVTVFAALMLTFPHYAYIFYPKSDKQIVIIEKSNIETVEFKIKGMTCVSCAEHVNHEVNKLAGIIKSEASYESGNAIVQFDKSKMTISQVEAAINSTGYTVTDKQTN
jgi:copper chaperone CopZ